MICPQCNIFLNTKFEANMLFRHPGQRPGIIEAEPEMLGSI